MPAEERELSHVIGRNVRKIRGARTMEDIAKIGRRLGFKWSSGSLASIEKGASRVTLETLAGLCVALAREDEAALPLSALIPPDSEIDLFPPITTRGESLLNWLAGDSTSLQGVAEVSWHVGEVSRRDGKIGALNKLLGPGPVSATPAVIRLAKRLGEDPDEVQYLAQRLWGQPFEDHRDELAGEGASPQRKGQIARHLQDELKAEFEAGRGDGQRQGQNQISKSSGEDSGDG